MDTTDEEGYHTCNKTSFQSVFCGTEDHHERIINLVHACNDLVFHATHVLKFYFLQFPDYNAPFNIGIVQKVLYLLNDTFTPRDLEQQPIVDFYEN